jgi:dipeptidyl aminopeptidase/acylaminoacyl peptidase
MGRQKNCLFLKRRLTNDLGLEVEYWVMKPTNYKQGEKYPLLLEIHGGPGMWGPGQESMWHEYQYFVVKAMVSCIAILADQGLRLDF